MRVEYRLDILKPHQPGNDLLARTLKSINGVKYVKIIVDEIDQKTTSIFVKIKGTGELTIEDVSRKLEEMNCSLHSVDRVAIYDEDMADGINDD